MVHLGYDAGHEVVRTRTTGPTHHVQAPPRTGAWREVGLDQRGSVRVPEGCALDLGATAKAWASDLVARSVVDALECEVVVSLGGDVRVDRPDQAAPTSWPVRITERPREAEPGPDGVRPTTVWLDSGGLATSSTTGRRWQRGSDSVHHVLDPRTALPTREHWRTVTATGPTCLAANTASTAALVLGELAVPWLEERQVSARLVSRAGTVHITGEWPGEHPTPAPVAGRRD